MGTVVPIKPVGGGVELEGSGRGRGGVELEGVAEAERSGRGREEHRGQHSPRM